MSEKEEALRQISEIKSHLVDRETFFPYNYNACYVWSIIAFILTVVMIPSYQYSILFGAVLTFVLMMLGFLIEGSMTKKVNQEYDIDDVTKRQQFIMMFFTMIALFSTLLSASLAIYKLYPLIYFLWLFLISLGYFTVGFILNIERFSRVAQFNMLTAMVLLVVGLYFNLFIEDSSSFMLLIQGVMILGLTILPAWVAWHQKKAECSV